MRNSGDLVATHTSAWNGGAAFVVQGAPLARSLTQADLGIQAWLSRQSTLDFGYSGRFSNQGNDYTLNARYTHTF